MILVFSNNNFSELDDHDLVSTSKNLSYFNFLLHWLFVFIYLTHMTASIH